MLKKFCEFVLVITTLATIVLLVVFALTKSEFCITVGTLLGAFDTLALNISDKLNLNLFKN